MMASIVNTVSPEVVDNSHSPGVTPLSTSKRSVPTKLLSKCFDMSQRTIQRKVGRGIKKRHHIITNNISKDMCKIPKRKGYSKITSSIKHNLKKWMYAHQNMRKSSHAKETIKMMIPGSDTKQIVPKYYLQVPIRELHADLIKPP